MPNLLGIPDEYLPDVTVPQIEDVFGPLFGARPTGGGLLGVTPTSSDGKPLSSRGYGSSDRDAVLAGMLRGGLAMMAASEGGGARTPGIGSILYTGLSEAQDTVAKRQAYDTKDLQSQIDMQTKINALQRRARIENLFMGLAQQRAGGGGMAPAMAPAAGAAPAAGPAVYTAPTAADRSLETSREFLDLPEAIQPDFLQAVRTVGLSPDRARIYARQVMAESGGRQFDAEGRLLQPRDEQGNLISDASGLAQVRPGTFRDMQQKYHLTGGIEDQLTNLTVGAHYYNEQADAFGDLPGVQAYHAGPENYRRGNIGPKTRDYFAKVTKDFAPLGAQAGPPQAGQGPAGAPMQVADASGAVVPVAAPMPTQQDAFGTFTPTELAMMSQLDPEDALKRVLDRQAAMTSDPEKFAPPRSYQELAQLGLPEGQARYATTLSRAQQNQVLAAEASKTQPGAAFSEAQLVQAGVDPATAHMLALAPRDEQNKALKELAVKGPAVVPFTEPQLISAGIDPAQAHILAMTTRDEQNKALKELGTKVPGAVQFERENTLRDDVTGKLKDFQIRHNMYGTILAQSPDNPSAVDDLALIYSWFHLVEPTSSVKEGEYANAENAGGIAQKYINMYNNILKSIEGGNPTGLTPKTREFFVDNARRTYEQARRNAQPIVDQYRRTATEYHLNPDNVAPNLPDSPIRAQPPAPAPANPTAGYTAGDFAKMNERDLLAIDEEKLSPQEQLLLGEAIGKIVKARGAPRPSMTDALMGGGG